MPKVHDDAICIRQWDWSETSQTVSLFTRNMGVVRALAKGAKRPKAPYSGGIELLTRAEAAIIARPNSDLALLTEWDLRQTYPVLRRSLAAHNAALYIADLVHHFVRDHDPHTALFVAMTAALDALAALPAPVTREACLSIVLTFQWRILTETGFTPMLTLDRGLSDEDSAEQDSIPVSSLVFDPNRGGLVNPALTPPSENPTTGWRVRSRTIELLRSLDSSGIASADAEPASVERAARLLASYIRHVLGTEPPSQPVVFGPRLPR